MISSEDAELFHPRSGSSRISLDFLFSWQDFRHHTMLETPSVLNASAKASRKHRTLTAPDCRRVTGRRSASSRNADGGGPDDFTAIHAPRRRKATSNDPSAIGRC